MSEFRAHRGGGLTAIEVAGHEEHAAGGRVCAAVSAITQTALLGIQAIAEQHPDLVSVQIITEE